LQQELPIESSPCTRSQHRGPDRRDCIRPKKAQCWTTTSSTVVGVRWHRQTSNTKEGSW